MVPVYFAEVAHCAQPGPGEQSGIPLPRPATFYALPAGRPRRWREEKVGLADGRDRLALVLSGAGGIGTDILREDSVARHLRATGLAIQTQQKRQPGQEVLAPYPVLQVIFRRTSGRTSSGAS